MKSKIGSAVTSRRSGGILLLVGVLAGVAVGGGVGAIATSSATTVMVCADDKTNVLRSAKSGKCAKNETSVVLDRTGATGAKGAIGNVGATGAKGVSGVVGAIGESGDVGARGETGDAGAVWSGGGAKAPVATGNNCIATKCTYKIGETGPGGGIIFFVDYNDVYSSLDYLEAAPMGWGNGITVNQGGLSGETTGSSNVDPAMYWCSNKTNLLGLNTLANFAVGAGAINTSTAEAMCEGGAFRAITDYEGGNKTDWFFPSVGETQLMYANLRIRGLGGFAAAGLWTSTESDANRCFYQAFSFYGWASKGGTGYIRPARAF